MGTKPLIIDDEQSDVFKKDRREFRVKKILVVGASGYVGKKIIFRLQKMGYKIMGLARNPSAIPQNNLQEITTFKGDLLIYESIKECFQGIDTAFYLAHSMGSKGNFQELEKQSAINFIRAAQAARIKRIIYLGALGCKEEGPLSDHLKSRKDVGEILRSSGIQVIEFQASIILGSGSLSYEMIRSLSERLPIMLMPKWVSVKAQPISINDVLEYLVQSIELESEGNEIFQIGGPNQVSYKDLISEYSRQRGLKRILIPVPVLTPRLSSWWLALITPVYARVGKKLIESIKNPTTVKHDKALKAFSKIKPIGVSEALATPLISREDH